MIIEKFLSFTSLVATILLAYASYLFLDYNQSIIQNYMLVAVLISSVLLAMMVLSAYQLRKSFKTGSIVQKTDHKLLSSMFLLFVSSALVMLILKTTVFDYFQPFSLFDNVIYMTIAAFLLFILRFLIEIIRIMIGSYKSHAMGFAALLLAFVSIFYGWSVLQSDFSYDGTIGDPIHLFYGGENGYKSYRIPSLLVLPEGERLADGTLLEDDWILAMAEARVNGSLDDGDIDVVMKTSKDGGKTWSDMSSVRTWDDGIGKIGNATPVFDSTTGIIHLFHIAGTDKASYETFVMKSEDGGNTWDEPVLIGEGFPGPGHGIQVNGGQYDGRLVIPGYLNGQSFVWLSDDHGESWYKSGTASMGDESEITQIDGDGNLIMVTRTPIPASKPHDLIYKRLSWSTDGGLTWTESEENLDLPSPICMSSIVTGNDGLLYYSYPATHYSRSDMTIAKSDDKGQSWQDIKKVYDGPAGYSELGVLSDDTLGLLFENGRIEYDERITFVIVD